MFKIEVTGLDHAIKSLDEMAESLTEAGLRNYCNNIKNKASSICGLKNDEFVLEPIANGDNISIDFKLNDSKKWLCIRKIIQSMLNSIPIPARGLFEVVVREVDKRTKS